MSAFRPGTLVEVRGGKPVRLWDRAVDLGERVVLDGDPENYHHGIKRLVVLERYVKYDQFYMLLVDPISGVKGWSSRTSDLIIL